MSKVLTEQETVDLMIKQIIDNPAISEYLDENCPFDMGDSPSNEQEDFFYATRYNLTARLLGLVVTQLYQPGVPKRPEPKYGPTWVEGKDASVEQTKMATDILERECTIAWDLVNAYADPDTVPDHLALKAHGLVNVLSDMGVEGYEMS